MFYSHLLIIALLGFLSQISAWLLFFPLRPRRKLLALWKSRNACVMIGSTLRVTAWEGQPSYFQASECNPFVLRRTLSYSTGTILINPRLARGTTDPGESLALARARNSIARAAAISRGGIIIIAAVNPVSRSLRSQQTLVVRLTRCNSLLGPIINSAPRSVTIRDAAKVGGGFILSN